MLNKTLCLILCLVLCIAPLSLITFAKVEYENSSLTESKINALPYDAKITQLDVENNVGMSISYVGFNIVPPIERLTSDSALNITHMGLSMGITSPYYYYGITTPYVVQYYRSANTKRYSTDYYVAPTICLKTDLLTIPRLYCVIRDKIDNGMNTNIVVSALVYDTQRNYTDITITLNPNDERLGNGNDYCNTVYVQQKWTSIIDIGRAIYDRLPQLHDNSVISFSCYVNQTDYCHASGLVTYLVDYSSRIYNTTGNYFNSNFTLTGYKGIGGYVSSLLGGFHNIMSTNILPHISLYTVFLTATAIPTTIAILRRL